VRGFLRCLGGVHCKVEFPQTWLRDRPQNRVSARCSCNSRCSLLSRTVWSGEYRRVRIAKKREFAVRTSYWGNTARGRFRTQIRVVPKYTKSGKGQGAGTPFNKGVPAILTAKKAFKIVLKRSITWSSWRVKSPVTPIAYWRYGLPAVSLLHTDGQTPKIRVLIAGPIWLCEPEEPFRLLSAWTVRATMGQATPLEG